MTINQLQYLKELVYTGNFSEAAENLGISQPALSAQIKQLEIEVELSLIDRNARPITLTKDGEAFFEISMDILQRMEALKNLPVDLEEDIKGELKIGMIPTLAPYFVPLFIDKLQQNYPDLNITIEELITEDIVHKVRTGHLDAGVISTPIEVKKLHFRKLFYERFYLYVSNKHKLFGKDEVELNDFEMEDLWYLQEGNCFQNQVNAICSLAGNPKGRQNLNYKSNSIESLRRIVESTKGMTFIPELSTLQIPSENEEMIKPIKKNQPVREISLVFASVYAKKRMLDVFCDQVLKALPAYMKHPPSNWLVDTELKFD